MAMKAKNRRRSSSVTAALNQVPLNHGGESGNALSHSGSATPQEVKPLPAGPPRRKKNRGGVPELYRSHGLANDLKTGRWMLVPQSALAIMIMTYALYGSTEYLLSNGFLPDGTTNWFKYLVIPQYRLANGMYTKGWADFIFFINHIVVWSFVRQFMTIYVLMPMASSLGIRGGKVLRFTEQGYAIFYFTLTSTVGLYIMRGLPTWWYKTEYFWLNYPHREISLELKLYYLLQASYWLQQLIILAAKIEKPRKDFRELFAHHIVTLWLIGWSYGINLTYIGVSIFCTMDVSDIFLSLAKCVNYVDENASKPVFAVFVCVWTYFRHHLNIKILYSVYAEFNLIPEAERMYFRPLQDQWVAPWMKWQIFVPILLLQIINLFWYFLIWRILLRAILSSDIKDERSDDEDEPLTAEAKAKMLEGDKAE